MKKEAFENLFLYFILVLLFLLMIMPTASYAQVASTNPVLIIDDIICQGNENTGCDFITKKYYQQIGQVLDADEIADARLRLGTLIQFKAINIHLEKGSQRNHVIVVFAVNEASNIQYELGASYSHSKEESQKDFCYYQLMNDDFHRGECDIDGTFDRGGLSAKMTNFNFLGTGKELSLSFYSHINHSKLERSLVTPKNLALENTSKVNSQSHSINLNYYDPYVFGSPYYYLSAGIGGSYEKHDNSGHTLLTNRTPTQSSQSRYDVDKNFAFEVGNLSLGRRFGRHSYLAINLNKNFEEGHSFSNISYGWNSEDDTLFPTTGSAFTISHNFNHNDVGLSYKRNFSLDNNKVISLSGHGYSNSYSKSAVLSAKYSSHKVIDKLNGSYSGWHIFGGLAGSTFKYNEADSFSINLGAGYTHQTESMIYRLSLGLNLAERK